MLLEKIRLEEDEQILIQVRRHWFVIASHIAGMCIIALLPFFVLIFLYNNPSTKLALSTHTAEIAYSYILFLIFIWISIFNIWTNHYLDILTVTTRRVILINQKGFFWRNIASFRLERMQDLNVEVNGIIATMLDFGTIFVETAGHSNEELKATNLPNPGHIKSIILEASDKLIASATKPENGIDS